ncbi:MAG TPA: pilus assembly protein PilP, partial [Gammaproteobacteria bacterium]
MLLSGCIGDELSDLKQHVAEVKAKKGERIPPLPTFETYVTVPYAAAHLRDPFVALIPVAPVATKKSD